MKFSNAAKLKAAVKKIAADSGVTAQGVLQKYVLERFLCRLAASEYRDNFILKGGFLTSSLVGVTNRTTMDIDATATGFSVNPSTLKDVLLSICSVDLQDGFSFSVDRIESIREQDSYPGLRAYLLASFTPMTVPFYVDVTTGDAITPKPVLQLFWSMFDDGDYELLSYNLETLLAEKLDTILSRGILNTRSRDFYDIDLLWNRYKKTIKKDILANAIRNTMSSRNNLKSLDNFENILISVVSDKNMNERWTKYQQEYAFAAGKSFSDVCSSVLEILRTAI
ncbi:MAG: nucleotidyl transferase AbiEii/AbiGii toxin family protein [Fibrobacter sp.]|uniref:nucleotidyl transferase AbiEii/AbiGii toxin family protein n=1 Tax=Fibrobacter sp. TaxID=35828 RepID=UPI0025B9F713|nr:nucleotidyl transferase AbiEii/AbiGii toxin family protein [Fibrobacter sp.]MBQ7080081.1 nucleotidyl transferase AbiEii/AbiGii toxin family protein [Fibrobacter sp.]